MPLIDAKTLAVELGFTPKQVRRLAKAGKIPSLKFASEWRFDLDQVKRAGTYVDPIRADAQAAARRAWQKPEKWRRPARRTS